MVNKGSKDRFDSKITEQKNYYLQDELGSPIRLVDGKGKTTERYRYDEFGTPLSPKMALGLNKSSNPFGFTGYQYDTTTGLYFAQARYFDSGVGRFVSEDRYKGNSDFSKSLNLYIYCGNNPIVYVDLSGDKWFDDFIKDFGFIWDRRDQIINSDSQGRQILYWYLYGGGKERNIQNDYGWTLYMQKNELLTEQIKGELSCEFSQLKNGQSKTLNKTLKEFAIENGEDIVGYQYLHGVNSDLNLYKSFGATTNDIAFQIQGTIIKDKKGNVHTVNS